MENQPLVSDVDAAWAAGAFDGEGCVVVVVGKKSGDRIKVSAPNTDPRFCDNFKRIFGGSVSSVDMSKYNPKWRRQWRWEATGKAARAALERMLPHLCIKAEQARLALEFAATLRQGFTHTPETIARRVEIDRLLRELKKSPPPPEKSETEEHG